MATITQRYNAATGTWNTVTNAGPLSGWVNTAASGYSGLVSGDRNNPTGGYLIYSNWAQFRTLTLNVWAPGPLGILNTVSTGSGLMPSPNGQISFETRGQIIPRVIGTHAVTGMCIWANGITKSGEDLPGNGLLSFADGYGLPIDANEVVTLGRIWANGKLVYTPTDGPLLDGLTVELHQGSELQEPDADIVADKTAERTPGFRGLRYIKYKEFPLGEVGGSKPQTFVEFLLSVTDRLSLANVLILILAKSGLTLEAEGIDDEIDGAVFPASINPQQLLRDLSDPYNFDVIDGETVRIVRRAVNESLEVDYTLDTSVPGDFVDQKGSAVIRFNGADPMEKPAYVNVQYIDQDVDYEQNIQHVDWPEGFTDSTVVKTHQLNFGLTATEDKRLAYDMLGRGETEADTLDFSTRKLRPQEGDVGRIITPGRTFFVRNKKSTITPGNENIIEAKIMLTRSGIDVSADTGDVISNAVTTLLVDRNWGHLSCTRDFSRIVATEVSGFIWTSGNGGARFAARFEPGQRNWLDADDQYAIAADGTVWSTIHPIGKYWNYEPPIDRYNRVASNPSFSAVFGTGFQGAGATYQALLGGGVVSDLMLDGDQGEYVAGLGLSDDASIVAVAVASLADNYVAVSTNGGVNFGTPVIIPGDSPSRLAMSGDGATIVVLQAGNVPQISLDGGGTFGDANIDAGAQPYDVKISSDGTFILLVGTAFFSSGAMVFLSSDNGTTFDPLSPLPFDQPSCGCMSDDGSKIVVGFSPGLIYRSDAPFTTWTPQTA